MSKKTVRKPRVKMLKSGFLGLGPYGVEINMCRTGQGKPIWGITIATREGSEWKCVERKRFGSGKQAEREIAKWIRQEHPQYAKFIGRVRRNMRWLTLLPG